MHRSVQTVLLIRERLISSFRGQRTVSPDMSICPDWRGFEPSAAARLSITRPLMTGKNKLRATDRDQYTGV